ncbi:glycosyltransferase family 2 protein [Flavobacterium sp. 17A]|uniref:Glycosyltransferase family 2 protein n=1 Tax=Flavobacterium potami TaxID=2872310 RepID=A0A9X1HDD4_9FLAO|nr:glycosyltransferase family A protein [Flavobacterium potami]MBZ4036583.1 glycosyltransferase family 2 protein [Flavobacterium potami]
MITVYHQNNKVVKVCNDEKVISLENSFSIAITLMAFAKEFPLERIIWCHADLEKNVNWNAFDSIFHHNKIMASFNCTTDDYLLDGIGYIDDSIFINVNKNVSYPTWLASSAIGGISSEVLLQFENKIKLDKNFDYFLHSLSKLGRSKGLFCYSEPKLLVDRTKSVPTQKATIYKVFQFTKQHYRKRWVFLLFLNLAIYEKRFPLIPFLLSLRFKNRNKIDFDFTDMPIQSNLKIIGEKTIDVIIPTIGRKTYLYDVLKDLAQQTHLPENVIIIEQNPLLDSKSELDYLTTEKWPFQIKHIFTHQSGACNARNLALQQVTREWVFLNDDDNRFDQNLINDVFNKIEQLGNPVITTSYLQKNEKLVFKTTHQTDIFGSGNSFVKKGCLDEITFSKALEFGYGEDFDFGMQLRNKGFDVIYVANPSILHLKAPSGGFRIKHQFEWEKEKIQPKPSPTIMYIKQKYLNEKQILGYKLVLFFKILKKESPFKLFTAYKSLEEKWNASLKWSKNL